MPAFLAISSTKFTDPSNTLFGVSDQVTSASPDLLNTPFKISVAADGTETLIGIAANTDFASFPDTYSLSVFTDAGDGGAYPDVSTVGALPGDLLWIMNPPYQWQLGSSPVTFTIVTAPGSPLASSVYVQAFRPFPWSSPKPLTGVSGLAWKITDATSTVTRSAASATLGYGWTQRFKNVGGLVLTNQFTSIFTDAVDALNHIRATQIRAQALVTSVNTDASDWTSAYGSNPVLWSST